MREMFSYSYIVSFSSSCTFLLFLIYLYIIRHIVICTTVGQGVASPIWNRFVPGTLAPIIPYSITNRVLSQPLKYPIKQNGNHIHCNTGVFCLKLKRQSWLPAQPVVCLCPYKGPLPASVLRRTESSTNRTNFSGEPKGSLLTRSYFLTFFPLNGSIYSFRLIWSFAISSWSCSLTYSAIFFSFLPTVST